MCVEGTFVKNLLQMGRKFTVYYREMCTKFITNVPSTTIVFSILLKLLTFDLLGFYLLLNRYVTGVDL